MGGEHKGSSCRHGASGGGGGEGGEQGAGRRFSGTREDGKWVGTKRKEARGLSDQTGRGDPRRAEKGGAARVKGELGFSALGLCGGA